MSGNKSSRKGSGYERNIANNYLTDWCEFEIIRTPMSGAWAGTSADLIPRRRDDYNLFPLTIECKKTESWDFFQILNEQGVFHTEWLPQLSRELYSDIEQTGIQNRIPLLIFSKNFRPDYIAIPNMFVSKIALTKTNVFVRTDYNQDYHPSFGIGFRIFKLEDFISIHTYKQFLDSCQDAFPYDI